DVFADAVGDGRAVVDWLRAKGGSKSELERFSDLLDHGRGATSTASSARTTRMPAPAIPTAVFTARLPGGRRSSATWATPRWRTGMGWRWPAPSRLPPALPSVA